jgi:UDP-3-O-[3-hydroxymyristoyl] N-acetylglucosamine deacetylase
LRFPDEYVRHKVLDLIGDLALAGKRIQGKVFAMRAGHAMHTALVSRLLKDRSAWELAHGPVPRPVINTVGEPAARPAFAGA